MGSREGSGMVDITRKSPVRRTATASGLIRLKESSIESIRTGQVKKGDVISTARVAAILAVKETPRLMPFCHQIEITAVDVGFEILPQAIRATVSVTSIGKTGVEMEALAGVAAALLNIWDMAKALEKDQSGGYPFTEMDEIRVLEKRKDSV